MTEDESESKDNSQAPTAEEERPNKQQRKMLQQAPDSEWPSAWLMPDGECEDQKALNQRDPNVVVDVDELRDLGIK